jgi:DNA replication protein DnaC
VSAAAEMFHTSFRSPEHCGVCLGKKEFRWYAYASVEWQEARDDPNRATPIPNQERTFACDCREQWLIHRSLAVAGVALSYQRMSVEDLTAAPALKVYERFRGDFEENLSLGLGMVLIGDFGVGKTLLANLLVKDALRRGSWAFIATFARLLRMYERTWHDKDFAWWWENRVRHAPLLVVDDIGKETKAKAQETTNMTRGLLDDLIRYRVSASLSTIVTTNVTTDLFGATYGEGLGSLFGGSAEIVRLTGSDFRQQHRVNLVAVKKKTLTRPVML